MDKRQIRDKLRLIMNTVLSLKVDGTDQNWNKLLGILNTIKAMIDALDGEVNDNAVREMGDN